MVKKLISGLLKKKDKEGASEGEASNESSEDVPDELPPLAEDVLEESAGEAAEASKEEAPAKEAEPAAEETPEELPPVAEDATPEDPPSELPPAPADEVPEELPSLDIEEPEEEAPAAEGADDSGALPDAIKKAKAAKQGDAPAEAPKEEAPAEAHPAQPPGAGVAASPPATIEESGFFSSILQHVKSKEGSKEKLLGGDLFSRMSNYYELKKGTVKGAAPSQSEHRIELDIQSKLEELKDLEKKWHVQKMALDEDLKFLHERERDIQNKVEELKKLTNELGMFKNVEPKDYFSMENGVVLRNMHDLLDALEIIDDDTFRHHVNKDRNDFADWVHHVMSNKKFSEKLRKAASKEEMINLLETEQPIVERRQAEYKHRLPPNKYFWLSNGVVIKSLYQLSDALKMMDEELFEKHVDTKKNDFAHWVLDSLKNEELAKKLDAVRTKKEMSDILDIYL